MFIYPIVGVELSFAQFQYYVTSFVFYQKQNVWVFNHESSGFQKLAVNK